MCVLYSKRGEHHKAVSAAYKAIESVLNCLKDYKEETKETNKTADTLFLTNVTENDSSIAPERDTECIEIVSMLYMAYYKFGIESERVGLVEKAFKLIETAKEIYKFITQFCENSDSNFDKLCLEALGKLNKRKKIIEKDERIKGKLIYKSYVENDKKPKPATIIRIKRKISERKKGFPVIKKNPLRIPEKLKVYSEPYPKKLSIFKQSKLLTPLPYNLRKSFPNNSITGTNEYNPNTIKVRSQSIRKCNITIPHM
jgi:hypothetical protein